MSLSASRGKPHLRLRIDRIDSLYKVVALVVLLVDLTAVTYYIPWATNRANAVSRMTTVVQSKRKSKPLLPFADLLTLAANRTDTAPSVQVAVCHKTLFGNINLDLVAAWVSYQRLLGFDHIFMWYLVDIKTLPGFRNLMEIPFLTLLENDQAVLPEDGSDIMLGRLDQRGLETLCIGEVAKEFDWVMLADEDEFLWFEKHMGVKEFLHQYASNYSYLSFGKYLYTMNYYTSPTLTYGFGIENFPFTSGRYCFAKRTLPKEVQAAKVGNPICPLHHGRSKIMVRPAMFKVTAKGVDVHGTHIPEAALGSYHFHSDVAHLKEWPALMRPPAANPVLRKRRSFNVTDDVDLNTHHALSRSHRPNADGTFNISYDKDLADWLHYVIHRATS